MKRSAGHLTSSSPRASARHSCEVGTLHLQCPFWAPCSCGLAFLPAPLAPGTSPVHSWPQALSLAHCFHLPHPQGSSLPHLPLPGIQLSLLVDVTNCLPENISSVPWVKFICFYRSLLRMVLPLSLAQAIILRCELPIDLSLEDLLKYCFLQEAFVDCSGPH